MSHCLRGDFRSLIDITKMPQRPAKVAQRCRADVLSILIAGSGMLFCVIECARPLQVLAPGDELAQGDIGCTKRAMREAERGGVAMALGLSHEFQRRVLL